MQHLQSIRANWFVHVNWNGSGSNYGLQYVVIMSIA